MSAGFVLGQFTMVLKLIPSEAKQLALGLNLALTALVAAAAGRRPDRRARLTRAPR